MLESLTNRYLELYNELLTNMDTQKYMYKMDLMLTLSYEDYTMFGCIEHIRDKIFELRDKNMKIAYKTTLYNYIKSDILLEIDKLCRTNKKLEKNILNVKCPFETITKLKNILQEELYYMNSYSMMPMNIRDIVAIEGDVKVQDKYVDLWYDNTADELILRLIKLTKHYGGQMLKEIGIEIISTVDISHYTSEKIIHYYNTVIRMIKRGLEKYGEMCEMYISVEMTYMEILLTLNEDIEINGIELIISDD